MQRLFACVRAESGCARGCAAAMRTRRHLLRHGRGRCYARMRFPLVKLFATRLAACGENEEQAFAKCLRPAKTMVMENRYTRVRGV